MDSTLDLTPQLARQQLRAWLILAFRAPTRKSVEQMLRTDLSTFLQVAGLDLDPDFGLSSPERAVAAHDELESAYVRLFLNAPGGAPAHLEATAYLVDAGPEAITAYMSDLADAYETGGWAPHPDAVVPADHLTLLLERLYLMEDEGAGDVAQELFVHRFLAAWVPEMARRLMSADPPPLYRAAATILIELLGLRLEDEGPTEEGHGGPQALRTPE